MAYESFTVDDVKQKLGLSVREAQGIFAGVPPVAPSAWLEEALREGTPRSSSTSAGAARARSRTARSPRATCGASSA
jgi:hypothetical protein